MHFSKTQKNNRIRIYYSLVLLLCSVFVVRLFYLQVIRHGYYKQAALFGQLKEYEIPAQRGVIEAYSGDSTTPIVLNETKYTLFADPSFIDNSSFVANQVAGVIGGDQQDYQTKIDDAGQVRYVVLAKKLSEANREKLDSLEIKGLGTREAQYRTYPQGRLAAQVLGFVNDEGNGTYGVEQALNGVIGGKAGRLKAITDANGVPLASNQDNVEIAPEMGSRVLLTIDIGLQQQVESILKANLERAKSDSGSVLVIEAQTGAIKAMANYPTYDPSKFFEEKDPAVFVNDAVASPLEIGSIMKPFTLAAALDSGSVTTNSSYFDPGVFVVDNYPITNVEEVSGSATRSVSDIIRLSLNTGATWLLMQMGGGEINETARVLWHDYMTNHYRFGLLTGVEQGYEASGTVPDPKEGFGLDIQYANTAFGQGMNATILQMGAGLAALVNGGTYYQPRLVDSVTSDSEEPQKLEPKVLGENVVKPETSKAIRDIVENAYTSNHLIYGMKSLREGYSIGGKTGTAQITKPEGGYYDDRFNGTFMGFLGGDEVQYVVVVRVNEPKIGGYAGSQAAAPLFVAIAENLIDNFGVTPKSQQQ